tara:strand:- start:11 stop:538 length:528 start_codon:yes stop_codon:yes gene_type:complete
MAHEFQIKTTSGELVTYTDYDAIDLTTLKHVIKFLPDLGTLVDSHEILLETGTLNASASAGVITEENNSVTATDGTTYAVPAENKLLLEDNGQIMYENAALNPLGKLVPENFADGLENHLVLETSPDTVADNHYHLPVGHHHEDGDGHTAAEHRELHLWNYKLQLLMARERLNNS